MKLAIWLMCSFLTVCHPFAVSEAVESFEDFDFEAETGNEYEEVYVPNISEFANGLDFASGTSKGKVFRFTYSNAEKGLPAFKHEDLSQELTYKLPDQLTFRGWAGSCSSQYVQRYQESSSVSEYLKTSTSSFGIGYDHTTDVTVTVPIKGAEVQASTQLRTAGGFGTSSGAMEYYQQIRGGKQNVIRVAHAAGLWTASWKRYKPGSTETMPGEDDFSAEFKAALARLKEICSRTIPTEKERLAGKGTELSMTKRDREAREVVAQFGAHYTKEGTFGGETSINFYYNKAATTTTDMSNTEEYTQSEFALLFFGGSTSSSSSKSSYSSEHMRSVVKTGSERKRGGDPSIKDTGAWCKSVRKQPALIAYNEVTPISELVQDDDSGKYALFMYRRKTGNETKAAEITRIVLIQIATFI